MAFRNLPEMPCGPILELHGQRKRFHVPYGLKRLIEEMTREVLRFQPENIYDFLAGFMELRLQKKLAEEEKNQKRKSWQQHRWSWQGESVLEPEELKEFLESLPAPVEQVEHHAVVIQAAFRGYQARKKVKDIRKTTQLDSERRKSSIAASEARRKEGREDEEGGQQRKRSTRMSVLINPTEATEEELHSAVVIQAAFRGMHARNELKKLRASLTEGKRQSEFQKKTSVEEREQDGTEPVGAAQRTTEPEVPATQDEEVSQTPQVEAEAAVTTTEGEEPPPSLTEPEATPTEPNNAPMDDGKDAAEVKDGDEQKPSTEEPKAE